MRVFIPSRLQARPYKAIPEAALSIDKQINSSVELDENGQMLTLRTRIKSAMHQQERA